MNFHFKNITKDAFLTVVGVFLAVIVLLFVSFLVWKEKISIEQAQNFLALIMPILIGFFSLAGRKNE